MFLKGDYYMCNARPLYRVSYKMTEEIYREANRLLYRKRIPGICLIVFCFCIIALIPDISAGIMEGSVYENTREIILYDLSMYVRGTTQRLLL